MESRDFLRVASDADFRRQALELFRRQAREVPVYAEYVANLGVDPAEVRDVERIPFLPVEFFKSRRVLRRGLAPRLSFTSSSTTGRGQSVHHVADPALYRDAFMAAFRAFYGDPAGWRFLFLLPSYLEREGSSLVYMARELAAAGGAPGGFFLRDFGLLARRLAERPADGVRTMLFGVTFALLEFARACPMPLAGTVVMETGGMKGHGPELPRAEVHRVLGQAFGVDAVHSEYGMAELMSQAYSAGGGLFRAPAWMRVLPYDPRDPLAAARAGRGGANIVDLANRDSCAFIQTADLCRVYDDGSFEIQGRFDGSEIRGCNLLV